MAETVKDNAVEGVVKAAKTAGWNRSPRAIIIAAFMRIVQEEYDLHAQSRPRVAAMAKALAVLDGHVDYLDSLCHRVPAPFIIHKIHGKEYPAFPHNMVDCAPLWALYMHEAEKALTALDKISEDA